MSKTEQYSWASLVTTGAIYLFFKMRMLDGWLVAEQSPGRLFWTYVAVVVLAIIAETIISGAIFARRKGAVETDERDRAIDARAEANSSLFMAAAINVIVIHAVAMAAFPDNQFQSLSDSLALASPAQIFFVLFTVLFAAHWVKLISALVMYRGA